MNFACTECDRNTDNCNNCEDLTSCNNCNHCYSCKNCECCTLCDYCKECTYCYSCYYCEDCYYSYGCKSSRGLNNGIFCKKVNHCSYMLFCLNKDNDVPYQAFNKVLTHVRYKEVVEAVIAILPNWQNSAVAGFWQSVNPKQWKALSEIPEFDKEIVEQITKIEIPIL